MALSLIDLEQHHFHLLCSGQVFELHLDKAEAAATLRLSVPHHDGISHSTVFLEVIDQIRLYIVINQLITYLA